MSISVLLRRKKLGKGSCEGIKEAANTTFLIVRNWQPEDWERGTYGPDPTYVFRWGCTSNVPDGVKVVNTAKAIHWCTDKRQGRLDMQAAGVPVPETWPTEAFGGQSNHEMQGRFVARPAQHAQGRNLLHGEYAALRDQLQVSPVFGGGYVSRLINKVAEYRVFVCQNRAVWVARKTPGNPDQVAWNVAQGGRFDNVRWGEWPLRVIKAALAAAKVSGCDFCGVDVMVDAEGKPYVLEVNSAPSQTSAYRQQCVAKAFDYIVANGKEHFGDVPDGPNRTWKSYIHPALRA